MTCPGYNLDLTVYTRDANEQQVYNSINIELSFFFHERINF